METKNVAASLDFLATEAYNVLRTNLTFSMPDKKGGRVIGVTSPNPQEGKSFTAINMCYSLAKDGHKTILISADLRLPSVENTLKMPSGIGLSNILADNAKSSLEEIIHPNTLHENLSFLTAGEIPPNPSELLGSERMGKLLERLSSEYEYVVLDLPPVNSVIDPVAVSKYLDGMVIVVKHGYTRKQNIRLALEQFNYVGAHILGFVYNEYHSGGRSYKKSGGYYSYNRYYSKYYKSYYKKPDSNDGNKGANDSKASVADKSNK